MTPDFNSLLDVIAPAAAAPAPAAKSSAATGTGLGATDASSLLDVMAPAAAAPTGRMSGKPEEFVKAYLPLAERVGAKTGVSAQALLGQWGLETGWGKSVIPGTNNLGNIKDPSGQGAMAVDNMTRTSDAYKRFDTPEAFGDHFSDLLARRYGRALNAGDDSQKFFTGLKAGGYAEDAAYVQKGVDAANRVAAIIGKDPQQIQAIHGAGRGITPAAAPGTYVETASDAPLRPKLGLMDTALEGARGGAKSSQALSAQVGSLILNTAGVAPDLQKRLLEYADGKNKEISEATGGVSSFSDAIGEGGDLPRWIANSAGYLGYQVVEAIATGGFGALVGKTVGKTAVTSLAKGMIEKEIGVLAATDAAKTMTKEQIGALAASKVAGQIGAASTIFANNMRQEGGSIYGDAMEEANKTGANVDVGRVWLASLAAAGVDTVADISMAKGALGMKEGSTAATYAGRLAREVPKNMAVQGGTEAVQTAIEQVGAKKELGTADSIRDIVDSAAVGALGGAGGAVGVAMHKRDVAMAPIVERAAQPNSPLSKAAVAGNTGAAADAHLATQVTQNEQVATQNGQAEAAANIDPLQGRSADVVARARASGAMDALRNPDSPIQIRDFVKDLTIAQSPSTPQASREQALSRLELAMEWAGANPAAKVAKDTSLDQQIVGGATESAATKPAKTMADKQAAVDAAAYSPTEIAAENARKIAANDAANEVGTQGVGKKILMDGQANPAPVGPATADAVAALQVEPFLRTAAQKAIVNAAERDYAPEDLALVKRAAAGGFSLTGADKRALKDMDARLTLQEQKAADKAALGTVVSPVGQKGDVLVRDKTVDEKLAAGVEQQASGPTDVQTPRVTAEAGTGPAAFRKRRAELSAIADSGLTTVERRNDGKFFMVDGTRKRQYKLASPADAQLARKAIKDYIDAKAHAAATSPSNDRSEPTGAQIDAVNWKKGDRFTLNGQTLVIENPEGSTRKSKPGFTPAWETKMAAHYGDIAGTKGMDGDPVDVFVGPEPHIPKIFVIDQVNKDGTPDEHKVMMGYPTEAAARAGYLANYEKGWTGLGAITEMEPKAFNTWVKSEATQKPLGDISGATRQDQSGDAADRGKPAGDNAGAGVPDGQPGRSVRDAAAADGVSGGPGASAGKPVAAGAGSAGSRHVTVNVDGKPTKVALADVKTPQAEMMRVIGGLFGKDVEYFNDVKLGDGFVTPAQPGKVFLNEKSSISPLAVFGHEILHKVQDEMPDVHASLVKVVNAKLKAEGRSAYRRDYYGKPADGTEWANTPLQANEINELTSDVGGNLMSDKAFWNEVFEQVAKDSPAESKAMIAKLADAIYKLIDQLLKSIKQGKFKTAEMVAEVEGVREAFRDGLAKYITAHRISKAAMQAEILKAGQKAKKSTVRDITKNEVAALKQARDVLDDVRGNINPERGYAEELEAEVQAAVSAIDSRGSTPMQVRELLDDLRGEINPERGYADELEADIVKAIAAIDAIDGDKDAVRRSVARDSDAEHRQALRATGFWGRVGAGSVVMARDTGRILLPHRSQDVQEPGTWGTWGGAIDEGESPVAAAKRELTEEAGLDQDVEMTPLLVFQKGDFKYHNFLATVDKEFDPKLNWETQASKWVDAKNIPEPMHPGLKSLLADKVSRDAIDAAVAKHGASRDNVADEPAANDTASELGRSPAPDAGAAPEHGTAREGAVSVLGRHYSTGTRNTLSGSAFGRGLKGAERERLAGSTDPRLKKRIAFYIDNGKGIRPESGVGAYAHEVRLNNIYDPRTKLVKYTGDLNNFESAVLDAGFDGYMIPDFTSTQGAAVLLGKASEQVPVKALGQPAAAPAPADASPQSTSLGLMSKELNSIDVSKIPGATLRNGTLTVPAGNYTQANTELARIGSPVRFSTARESDAPADQHKAVEAKYRGTDKWMKAPNGQPTALTERQWVHVRTPAFKAWFGDWEKFTTPERPTVWYDDSTEVSKAVHENGEPLVVYHGADSAGFSEFNKPGGKGRGDLGIFTADSWNTAASYVTRGRARRVENIDKDQESLEHIGFTFEEKDGGVELTGPDGYTIDGPAKNEFLFKDIADAIEAAHEMHGIEKTPGVYGLFVNIRNPGEQTFEGATWTGDMTDKFNVMLPTEEDPYTSPTGEQNFDRDDADRIAAENDGDVVPAPGIGMSTDDVVREARNSGNDGAIIHGVVDDGPGSAGQYDPAKVFVAFDPSQLKSADFNNGEYAVGKDDIRFSTRRDQTETPAFKAWFGDSKVVDANGKPLVVYHGTTSDFGTFKNVDGLYGWFTSDANYASEYPTRDTGFTKTGTNVKPAYLSLNNPAPIGMWQERAGSSESRVNELASKGYDGIMEERDGTIIVAAFRPEQIKSAIGNNGEFDSKSADITQSTKRDQEVKDIAGPLLKLLTPTEKSKLRRDTAQKLVDTFRELPSANEMAAVAFAGRAKKGWYDQSAKALSHVFGHDAPRFAALLAAMSPQTSVETNLRNALKTWENWTAEGRPTARGAIFEIMGRSVEGNKLTDSVLPAWVPNSVRALTSAEPSAIVLSGPKVNSFMLNLRGNVDEVTNDAWMANYALVDQKIFSGSLNVAGTDPGKGPGYMAMSAKVREAARTLTKLTGETWTPAEVQETVWSWAKTLFELQNKDMGARELLDNKAVTDELIASTPDFSSQLTEERNEDTLQRAGYGEQLGSLRGGRDSAASRSQESPAGSQASPFDPDTQGRLERRAGARLEQLRAQRDAAERETRESNSTVVADQTSDFVADWSARRDVDDAGLEKGLDGLPDRIEIPGHGTIAAGRLTAVKQVAEQYMRQAKLAYIPPTKFVKADPVRGKRISDAYEAMAHEPQNPVVKAAYQALIREVKDQYQAVLDAGLKIEFIDMANGDPYAASPRLMTEDVRKNNHMWVFSTRDGYGSTGDDLNDSDNPMLAETKFKISGKTALANDLFRVVHDYFGHVKEGLGFRADGEENAWRAHSAMFTSLAQRALTSETRGQNSWVNFGPRGETNRSANGADTVYADQKTGLMPNWVSQEARFSAQREPQPVFYSQLQRAIEGVPDRLATMAAPQWKLWLDANAGKLGVKKDEVEWSGIKDYLDTRGKDKVTRDELAAYMAENGVRVTDVVLGGPSEQEITAVEEAGFKISKQDGHFTVVKKNGEMAWELPAPIEKIALQLRRTIAKYDEYTVPGGENYREMLITLPPADRTPAFQVVNKKLSVALKTFDSREAAQSWIQENPGIGALKGAEIVERPAGKPAKKEFKSSHWDEPNIVAHLRVDDRTDADGKKVLFINEIQSDWGQQGKKQGFNPGTKFTPTVGVNERDNLISSMRQEVQAKLHKAGESALAAKSAADRLGELELARITERVGELNDLQSRELSDDRERRKSHLNVPLAPFVTKTEAWVGLAMKRAIVHAAQQGYDKVALISGEQAAELYDLSKSVNFVRWSPNSSGVRNVEIKLADGHDLQFGVREGDGTVAGVSTGTPQDLVGKSLSDIIGKEVAEKILGSNENGRLSGDGLKVGGEGMKAFYDKIVPQVANDILKKLGGSKVSDVRLGEARYSGGISGDDVMKQAGIPEADRPKYWRELDGNTRDQMIEAERQRLSAGTTQPGFDITPAMREKLADGAPLFSAKRDQTDTPAFKDWSHGNKLVPMNSQDPRQRVTGKPVTLEALHGTAADFSAFDMQYGGQTHGTSDSEGVMWFTTHSGRANAGARDAANSSAVDDESYDALTGANVMPVWLRMDNPYFMTDAELGRTSADSAKVIAKAREDGHDGVVMNGEMGGFDYAIFDPRQVKSSIGNDGGFDATSSNITESKIRDTNLLDGYKVSDLLDTSKNITWWDKSIGTPYHLGQKHPEFKRVYDAVQNFISDVSRYATRAADLAPTILPKLENMKDIFKSPLSAADVKALSGPIFQGTLSYTRDKDGNPIKTDDVGLAGVVWRDEEMRTMWNLTDPQIALYREFRRATNKSIADLAVSDMIRYAGKDADGVRAQMLNAEGIKHAADLLAAHLVDQAIVDPDRAEVLQNTAHVIKEKAGAAQGLIAKGYAPLTRYGDYTVYVTRGEGETMEQIYFGMYETEREANKAAREMRETYPDAKVETGTMSKEAHKLFKGITPETMALFGEALGLEEDSGSQESQMFQEMLKLTKSTRSAMKRLIERKGVEGYSDDSGRVLAGFVYSNSRQASQNLHSGEIAKSANEISKEKGDLKDHAIKLTEYAQNPQEEAQAIRGMMFTQYIGGSLASAATNLTQSLTTTLPTLTQHFGMGRASTAMMSALNIAKNGAGGDEDLAKAMKRAEEDGITAPQETHQLMAQAQGRGNLRSGDGTKTGDTLAKLSNSLAKVQLIWGKAFGWAEIVNRKVAFVAAYKLAREKGMKDPFDFARKIVTETQYVMNKGNNPNWARGPVGATLFTFKKFMVNYLEGLARMWSAGEPGSVERTEGRKAFALSLAIMFVMAGAGGFPFADDLDDVIDGFAQRVLNKSFSSKAEKKAFFGKILGDAGADFVLSGISGLPGAPIDVSGRLGLGNLIPGTGMLTKKQDYSRDSKEILGAGGDFAARVLTGAGAAAQGDFGAALQSVIPVAAANAYKASQMASLGYYQDLKGRKVIDTTITEAVLKGIGFQPASVKKVQEATGIQQSLIAQNKIRETEIADMWARGRIEGKGDLVEKAKGQMKEWNQANPESQIRIDAGQINKRVQQANMTKAQRIEKTAPKEIRKAVKSELERDLAQ